MTLTLRHLPVIQNWDCHVCGSCCREYRVGVTDEERQCIAEQGWQADPDIGDLPLFQKVGRFGSRRYILTQRGDGRCLFLSEQGRCRIHERFGGDAKPLACQLFPFVLVPAGDEFRIGMRFACPSAAANKGRPTSAHHDSILRYAEQWARQKGILGKTVPPPPLVGRARVDWDDLFRFVEALRKLVQNRQFRMERRLRLSLALVRLCRQAQFERVRGPRLDEFLNLVSEAVAKETPRIPQAVRPPSRVGRLLFRQSLALFTRQDHGVHRGDGERSTPSLLFAAVAFIRGKGPVPRLHALLPEVTFEELEEPADSLSTQDEELLERYYDIKIESLQFCGPANFGMPFWEGFESLALTLPIILWLRRALMRGRVDEPMQKAVSIVDNPFGFSPILGLRRQRFSFGFLARSRDLEKLIAWYGR